MASWRSQEELVTDQRRKVGDRIDHVIRPTFRPLQKLRAELAGSHVHPGEAGLLRREHICLEVVAHHGGPFGPETECVHGLVEEVWRGLPHDGCLHARRPLVD